MTKVVHLSKAPFDIYIGRKGSGMHYGNPFAFKKSFAKVIMVSCRESAIKAFELWLTGKSYKDVEPQRRQWILDNLHRLKGKKLGCYCAPAPCHGDILVKLLEKSNGEETNEQPDAYPQSLQQGDRGKDESGSRVGKS